MRIDHNICGITVAMKRLGRSGFDRKHMKNLTVIASGTPKNAVHCQGEVPKNVT